MRARLFTDGGARGNPGPAAFAYVLEAEDGTVLGAVLIFRDVSGRRRAEDRVRLAVEAAPDGRVGDELSRQLLERAQVVSVAVQEQQFRGEILPPAIDITGELVTVDLRNEAFFDGMIDAFRHMFAPPGRFLRIILSPELTQDASMEVIVQEAGLTNGIIAFSRTLLLFSLLIAGRLITRIDQRWLLALGAVLNAYAAWIMATVNLEVDYWTLAWPRFVQGVGVGFIFVPLNTVALATIAREKMGNATAALNVVRNLGGGIGVALMTALLARRSQEHQTTLTAHVNVWDPETADRLRAWAQHFAAHGRRVAFAEREELQQIRERIAFGPAEVRVRDAVRPIAQIEQQAGDRVGNGGAAAAQDVVAVHVHAADVQDLRERRRVARLDLQEQHEVARPQVVRLPRLYPEARFQVSDRFGMLTAPIAGAAFAFGWSPCLGPVIAAVFGVAATQTGLRAFALLIAYSLGMGVSFLLVGLAFGRWATPLAFVKRHLRTITFISAGILAVFGLLLMFDRLWWLNAQLVHFLDWLGLDSIVELG